MVEFGKKYRDKITKFEGRATGRCEYITGCAQALIAPEVGTDGAYKEARWLDEQRLEEIAAEPIVIDAGAPGFDQPAPIR